MRSNLSDLDLEKQLEELDTIKSDAKFFKMQSLFDWIEEIQMRNISFKTSGEYAQLAVNIYNRTTLIPIADTAFGILDFKINPGLAKYSSDQYRYYFEFRVRGIIQGFDIGLHHSK